MMMGKLVSKNLFLTPASIFKPKIVDTEEIRGQGRLKGEHYTADSRLRKRCLYITRLERSF
jgi:hypothetical protein